MKKLLILFSIAALMPIFFLTVSVTSCNQSGSDTTKKSGSDTTKKEPCPEVAKGLLGTNFYELSLIKSKYEELRGYHGGGNDKMVVQFYFNTVAVNSPSLIAFASKTKNVFKKTGVTKNFILTITSTISQALPDEFVLGDQQVTFAAIDNLLRDAGIPLPTPASFQYDLIFKPKMDGKNVCYEICVKFMRDGVEVVHCLGDAGTDTKPSPPADAN